MIKYKRGRSHRTDTADWMTWDSGCGTFRIQECKGTLIKKTRYYALVHDGERFRMLEHMKTYKTRLAAERAIRKFCRPA